MNKEIEALSYQKLLEAQKEIGAIKKDSDNPFFKSKYFDINAILREVKPILNKHGLILSQHLTIAEGKNGLNTSIIDCDTGGTLLSSTCLLPEGLDAQKTGSAITYFRRYSVQSLLSLEAEDDNGNSASGSVKKSYTKPAETKQVEKFMEDIQPSEEDLIKYDELLDSSSDLKSLKTNWSKLPPLVQDKLIDKKNALKSRLS